MPTLDDTIKDIKTQLDNTENQLDLLQKDFNKDTLTEIGRLLALSSSNKEQTAEQTEQTKQLSELQQQFKRVREKNDTLPQRLCEKINNYITQLNQEIDGTRVIHYQELEQEANELIALITMADTILSQSKTKRSIAADIALLSTLKPQLDQKYQQITTLILAAIANMNEVIQRVQTNDAQITIYELEAILLENHIDIDALETSMPNVPNGALTELINKFNTAREQINTIVKDAIKSVKEELSKKHYSYQNKIYSFLLESGGYNREANSREYEANLINLITDYSRYDTAVTRIKEFIGVMKQYEPLTITKNKPEFKEDLVRYQSIFNEFIEKINTMKESTINTTNEINVHTQTKLNELDGLLTKIHNKLTLDDPRYNAIEDNRSNEYNQLSNLRNSCDPRTTSVSALCEEAREVLDRIETENSRINQLGSFVAALNALRQQSITLLRRDDGSEESVEWLMHRQLEAFITAVTAQELAYIQNPEPNEEVAIQNFANDCQTLRTDHLNTKLIKQARGWSITGLIDNITKTLDALIDLISGNQPETTTTLYDFFHRPTTTEKLVKNLNDMTETLRGSNLGH